jgi:hypothetical protein
MDWKASQELRLRNGKWEVTMQHYGAGYPEITFVRENGIMKISDFVVGP